MDVGTKMTDRSKPITYTVTDQGCWDCTSHAPDCDGYPRAKGMRIYRTFYQDRHGMLQRGTVLRHRCDNRMCVNPDHCLPGSHADNVQDRVQRGRTASGENHGRAKLTVQQVASIRQDTRRCSEL